MTARRLAAHALAGVIQLLELAVAFLILLVILSFLEGCAAAPQCRTRPCVPTLALEGPVNAGLAAGVVEGLEAWAAAGADAVVVTVDSQGGWLIHGKRIAEAFEASPVPTYCLVTGEAASMAFYLVVVSCTHRAALANAHLMTHNPFYRAGTERVEVGEPLQANLAETMSIRLRVSSAFLRWHLQGGARWDMTPAQGLEYGALDAVFDTPEQHLHHVFRKTTERRQ